MSSCPITPVTRPFRRTVTVPGSKSITNRALPLAALAQGTSTLTGVLFAQDTQHMLQALQTLGYAVDIDEANHTVTLRGMGAQIPSPSALINCGNSGTTIRFLTAMLTLGQGQYTLDGVARMRQRPIGQLVDQLTKLGAVIEYPQNEGFPPVKIKAQGLRGGECQFIQAASSQYISAILLAAPYFRTGLSLTLEGPITSEPYVQMTLRMMEQWGYNQAKIRNETDRRTILVPPGTYQPREYAIEPDASNASYFLAAAAICPGSSITIEGLGKDSLQGDVTFADVLHQMGAGLVFGRDFVTVTGPEAGQLQGIDLDMNHIPDMVQTLAVVALFAQETTIIRNVANLRVKETDRLAALENELRKLGAKVATTANSITITPPPPEQLKGASIATYDDHRMAMAFAVAGLRIPGVVIEDAECSSKTYPEYFADLAKAVG